MVRPSGAASQSCLPSVFNPLLSDSAGSGGVPGFVLVRDAVTPEEERRFLQIVDEDDAPWTARRTRLTKNYGPFYMYSEKDTPQGRFRVTDGKVLRTPIPPFVDEQLMPLLRRTIPMLDNFTPNQLHVALYRHDLQHKIRMHNDNKMGELGPYIVGMCFGADTQMTFVRPRDGKKRVVSLPRRCVYVMSGESHTEWRHGILAGSTPANRVSFTLRDVRKLSIEEGVLKVTKSSHAPSSRSIAAQMQRDSMRVKNGTKPLEIKLTEQISLDS